VIPSGSRSPYDPRVRTPGIEIERKYRLRSLPDARVLAANGAVPRVLEQVYLAGDPPGRRIRRIEKADGTIEHRLTRKERLRDFAFREEESVIDQARYEDLLAQADPARRRIRKTRHVVPHGDQVLEIDEFEVPEGLVLVEVELAHDDEPVELPDWLGDWVDVTGDPTFLNANLARSGSVVPDWEETAAEAAARSAADTREPGSSDPSLLDRGA
jgi:adenylate cyclase